MSFCSERIYFNLIIFTRNLGFFFLVFWKRFYFVKVLYLGTGIFFIELHFSSAVSNMKFGYSFCVFSGKLNTKRTEII